MKSLILMSKLRRMLRRTLWPLLLIAISASQVNSRAEELISPPLFVIDGHPHSKKEPLSTQYNPGEKSSLNLNEAIFTALYADPQIRAAVELIHQAEADLTTANLFPNPVMSTSGTLMPLNRSFTVDRQGGPPQFDLGIAYPVDWFLFGKRAAEIQSAQLGVEVAVASLNDTIRTRIAGTIAAFYDVLEAESLLSVAREDSNDLTELKRITEKRVLIGGAGSIELDRVNLSLLTSQTEVRSREVVLAGAISQLRVFLGIKHGRSIHIEGNLTVKHPEPITNIEQLIQAAEDNRPDIAMLKRQIEQSRANITLEETKAYPSVTPRAGVTRQFQEKAIGFPDANSWGIGVDISLPIFDRNQGNIAKAKSLQKQSELGLDAQLIELRSEIERTCKVYDASYLVLSNDAEDKLKVSRTIRDKMKAAYELGGKSLFELLDAQRNYRETYRVHIMTLSNYWHSLYALNAAIGKQVLQ